MNRILKASLTLIISMTLLTNLTGCASGDIKTPLTPIGVKNQTDKGMATVVFYLGSGFGIYDLFETLTVKVDDPNMGLVSEDTDPNFLLQASREMTLRKYMSNQYTPGKHTFSFGNLFVQTVDLEAGRTYYLAAEKELLIGVKSLKFRTYDNFIKWTKNAKQIEFTGEKCDGWAGCPVQDVIE